MAKCKYCKKDISRFDADICPHCGGLNPIEGTYQTLDITQAFKGVENEGELYRSKKKKTAIILGATLGFFGAQWFYLGFAKYGVIELVSTLVLTLGVGLPLFFTVLPNVLAFLIPFAVCYFIGIIFVIRLVLDVSPKDGNGELLR